MSKSPDYEAVMAAEDKAFETLKELSEQMAEECFLLWRYGDGHGGDVLEVVRNAFHERGCTKYVPSTSGRKRIPNTVKTLVFERDAYRCVKCTSYKNLCIDHVYPLSLGGSNEPENLQTLCWKCNSKKSNKVEVAA